MATTNQNATVYRGGSYTITVPITDEDGAPLNVTGIDLFYRVARQAGSTAAEVELSRVTTPAITSSWVASPAASSVSIPLKTADTEDLSDGSYYHELFMVQSGERHVLMTGTLTVEKSQAARYTP